MRSICNQKKRPGKSQFAILLTDSVSNIDKERTLIEAQLAKDDGIEIIVIGSLVVTSC